MNVLELIHAARAAGIDVSLLDGKVCITARTDRLMRSWVAKLRPHYPEARAWLAAEQAIERARATRRVQP